MRAHRFAALLGALTMGACSSYNRSTGDAAYLDLGMGLDLGTPPAPDRPTVGDQPTVTDQPTVGDQPSIKDAGSTTDLGYAPGVLSCARLCARLATSATCSGAQGGCETACGETLNPFAPRCRDSFVALFNCIESADATTIMCGSSVMFPFTTCAALNMTAVECVRR